MSSATYKNIVTTMKIKTAEEQQSVKHELAVSIDTAVDYKSFLCKGAGYGIAGFGFNYCDNPLDVDTDVGIFSANKSTGKETQNNEMEDSNSFSITWSFQTSEDPWTAGYTSDVFVVPNLFVAVEEVYEVYWNNTVCGPSFLLGSTPPFPSRLVFDLNSPPSEQALAFYSRYHVETDKLPTLIKSVKNQQEHVDAIERGEKVCCNQASCTPLQKTVCTEEQKETAIGDLEALQDGISSWKFSLAIKPEKEPLAKWMSGTGFGMDGMHTDPELTLDENDPVSSGIAPNTLIDNAERFEDVNLGNLTEGNNVNERMKQGIKDAKRMQISGKRS